jgi:hypothetical protein
MISYYLTTNNPTTCPLCGGRTNEISSFTHTLLELRIEECLNNECKNVFFEIER